jgi:TRAP-type C4-dicarboxylate transport system substrate-binding protein
MMSGAITRIESALATGLALALLAGCASSAVNKAGGSGQTKAVVLSVATGVNSDELDAFTMDVARLSRGTLKLDVDSRWRRGQNMFETGLIRDVQAGKADLGVVGSRAWDFVGVKSFRALSTPLLIDSYALQERVLRSPLPAEMLAGLKPLGLVGLGVMPGQLRYPFGTNRPLLGPASYRGLTIGVLQSDIAAAAFRALGAAKVDYIPAGGSVAGFGGIEAGTDAVPRAGYLTGNVVLWARPLVVFANAKAFGRLTAEQRSVLQRAASDTSLEVSLDLHNQEYGAAVLCRSGRTRFVDATPAEIAAVSAAVQPVIRGLKRDTQTRGFITQIEGMRADVAGQQPLTCSRSPVAVAERGQLDGVYEFTVTPKEMTAAQADPSEMLAENLGATVFVIDRGHFADTQVYNGSYGDACTWGYGTADVTSRALTLTFSDGGGLAPDNATNKPGEQFTYDLSLYRDLLTLTRPPGQTPPTPWLAVPWRRVSTTPSRSYLSKRCPPPPSALPG